MRTKRSRAGYACKPPIRAALAHAVRMEEGRQERRELGRLLLGNQVTGTGHGGERRMRYQLGEPLRVGVRMSRALASPNGEDGVISGSRRSPASDPGVRGCPRPGATYPCPAVRESVGSDQAPGLERHPPEQGLPPDVRRLDQRAPAAPRSRPATRRRPAACAIAKSSRRCLHQRTSRARGAHRCSRRGHAGRRPRTGNRDWRDRPLPGAKPSSRSPPACSSRIS